MTSSSPILVIGLLSETRKKQYNALLVGNVQTVAVALLNELATNEALIGLLPSNNLTRDPGTGQARGTLGFVEAPAPAVDSIEVWHGFRRSSSSFNGH